MTAFRPLAGALALAVSTAALAAADPPGRAPFDPSADCRMALVYDGGVRTLSAWAEGGPGFWSLEVKGRGAGQTLDLAQSGPLFGEATGPLSRLVVGARETPAAERARGRAPARYRGAPANPGLDAVLRVYDETGALACETRDYAVIGAG
ncbi:hypothetical protein [Marinicauda salina]|nr:hypothetical protein [Marinicauda salina]